MRKLLGCLVFLLFVGNIQTKAQIIDEYVDDERMLYAHTKQVNQFFRRFNGEEDAYGERFSVNDSLYRNNFYRKKLFKHLFDERSYLIDDSQKDLFINEVSNQDHPKFLDFHGGNWIAEVQSIFIYKGEEQKCTLFLKLQEEKVGSKWVISGIFFEPYRTFFRNRDSIPEDQKRFLHPLSHELDFMNLIKVFRKEKVIEQFAGEDYNPDYLSIFIYEFRKGLLQFKTIEEVKFHFFQIGGWYFELSKFNRKSLNSGWLISNLLQITEKDEKVLKSFIYQK